MRQVICQNVFSFNLENNVHFLSGETVCCLGLSREVLCGSDNIFSKINCNKQDCCH